MVEKSRKILIPIAIVIAGIFIAGAVVYINQGKASALSPQAAAEKAIEFINQNMLQEGISASLISAVEENGVYKFRLKVGENEFDSYVTKNGKLLFTAGIDLEKTPETQPRTQEEKSTIGNFLVSQDKICKENEKPNIYFFGSQGCPHCRWEHPIIEKVAKNFEGYISFHNNMDSEADMDVFGKYSTGGIPTLVFGCKYYRVGSGESLGEEEETKVLTALICKLTSNQPANVCSGVQALINQIE